MNISKGKCPSGWLSNQGQCYYYSTYGTDWITSNSYCTSQNAYLTVPSNTLETQFYYTNRGLVNNNWMWIGIYCTCKLIFSIF